MEGWTVSHDLFRRSLNKSLCVVLWCFSRNVRMHCLTTEDAFTSNLLQTERNDRCSSGSSRIRKLADFSICRALSDVYTPRNGSKVKSMSSLFAENVAPSLVKRAKREAREEAGANSFEVIALEWFNTRMGDKSKSHRDRTLLRHRCRALRN